MHPNYVIATDSAGNRQNFNTNQVLGVPRRGEFNDVHSVYVMVRNADGYLLNLSFTGSKPKMDALYNHLVNGSLLDLDEGDGIS